MSDVPNIETSLIKLKISEDIYIYVEPSKLAVIQVDTNIIGIDKTTIYVAGIDMGFRVQETPQEIYEKCWYTG